VIAALATRRLVATRIRAADFEELCAMHRDPTVMATLGGVRSAARTRAFLDANLRHWERRGFGLWIFRDKRDERFVGRGGLRPITIQGRPEVEIAYAVRADLWGKGIATEMATASLATGFGALALNEIVAFTLPSNHGSRRVMEKAGFRYERDFVHERLLHVLYRITREAFSR
jgi:ribosomal-protein-alanine N-acetyltransferase